MAPAKASTPPASQTLSMAQALGTSWATNAGTMKIPLPITLETTIAAPSSGPRSRRSAVGRPEAPTTE